MPNFELQERCKVKNSFQCFVNKARVLFIPVLCWYILSSNFKSCSLFDDNTTYERIKAVYPVWINELCYIQRYDNFFTRTNI